MVLVKNDDEYQQMLRNLDAAREPDEPAAPQETLRLRIPVFVPWVARVLLAINIAVFAVPWILDSIGIRVAGNVTIYEVLLIWGAKENAAIFAGGQYYRFLTAMFLHGGLAHLFFNAFALYSLGFETERIFGSQRFLALYLIAGLGGGLASYGFNANPSVGASGAIFGLVGALSAFYYTARPVLGGIARQQLGSLMFVALINLAFGFTVRYIDNNAHIGGLLTGALAGWLLAPRFAIDTRCYPPAVARLSFRFAWPATLALLALLVFLAMIITPPLPI
ncbi:MAG: rhomboid family intramembrane serine protease [Chloroflexi bacterium]|nr:rhomboid family intramembrane serine protease [Chloroflexota bacterium]